MAEEGNIHTAAAIGSESDFGFLRNIDRKLLRVACRRQAATGIDSKRVGKGVTGGQL